MQMAPERTHHRISFERTIASARQTMVFSEIARLAVDSFRAAKVRFALTALGMVIGTASVILVVTISATGRQYILSEIEAIGTNLVQLTYAGGGAGAVVNNQTDFLRYDDEEAIDAQVPAVSASSAVLEMHQRIGVGNGIVREVLVLGVEPPYRNVRNLILLNGRFYDEEDEITHAKVADITEPFARTMFGSAAAAVGRTFQISGIPFTVIGTFKEGVETFGESEISEQTILIPYSVGRYFIGTDTVNAIYFTIRDQSDVQAAADQIVSVVHNRHQPNSVYKAATMFALITMAGKVVNALTIMLLLVSMVTLAVGGVGIMNIMLATVRSRIREIGIRKALGATSREIHLQFLTEAVLVSLFGGVIGTMLGLCIPVSVRLFTDYRVPLSAWSAVAGLGASAAVGIVFGTWPANRAARLDPIESLRYE